MPILDWMSRSEDIVAAAKVPYRMLEAVPKDKMPRLSSVRSLIVNGVAFVGPLAGAALSDATSLRTALFAIGGLLLLSTVTLRMLPSDV